MERLRVGVVGCGTIAQVMHLPSLHELRDRYELAALCDVSPGTLAAVGDRYGVEPTRRYRNWEDLVAAPLDAVMVFTTGSHHAPPCIAAARAGRHVFVEKPLCYTLREADAMIAAAAGSGVVLMVGNMKRFDPAYRHAQSLVARLPDARLARVTTLEAPAEPYLAHHRLTRVADLDPDLLARLDAERDALLDEALGAEASPVLRRVYAGVLLDSLVHEVNMLRGLLGEPEAVTSAEVWREGEGVTAVLRFPGDLRCVISWINLPNLAHYSQELAFYGPADRVILRLPSPYLRHAPSTLLVEGTVDGAASEQSLTESYEEAFEQELLHFHACATEGLTPLTTADSARRDLVVLQALARAVASGHPQAL